MTQLKSPIQSPERLPHPNRHAIKDWLQVLIAIGAVIVLFNVIRTINRSDTQAPSPPAFRLTITPALAIGKQATWQGSLNAPYTLVEFADYQCPPCSRANERVKALLGASQGKVRLTFRNFPLVKIHPFAYPAAIAAETARQQEKFWQVHDALYAQQSDLRAPVIKALLEQADVDLHKTDTNVKRASQTIANDLSDGKACGVNGTPTFILCCPDGQVFRLGDLDQAQAIMKL